MPQELSMNKKNRPVINYGDSPYKVNKPESVMLSHENDLEFNSPPNNMRMNKGRKISENYTYTQSKTPIKRPRP